jgi:hypothetical protein
MPTRSLSKLLGKINRNCGFIFIHKKEYSESVPAEMEKYPKYTVKSTKQDVEKFSGIYVCI